MEYSENTRPLLKTSAVSPQGEIHKIAVITCVPVWLYLGLSQCQKVFFFPQFLTKNSQFENFEKIPHKKLSWNISFLGFSEAKLSF